MIYLLLVFSTFCSWAQEEPSAEPAKSMKNALSISGGTSFCRDRFFNPTYDVQYSRFLWKGLFASVGYKWQHHTIEKVNYTTGDSKWNFYYAFTGYIGLGWIFDITEHFSLSPSVTWGGSVLGWDYYASHSAATRRSHMFSCSAEYAINSHWSAFCMYSYNIHGKEKYLFLRFWDYEHERMMQERDPYSDLGLTNEFNCHDLKFGISFRF